MHALHSQTPAILPLLPLTPLMLFPTCSGEGCGLAGETATDQGLNFASRLQFVKPLKHQPLRHHLKKLVYGEASQCVGQCVFKHQPPTHFTARLGCLLLTFLPHRHQTSSLLCAIASHFFQTSTSVSPNAQMQASLVCTPR